MLFNRACRKHCQSKKLILIRNWIFRIFTHDFCSTTFDLCFLLTACVYCPFLKNLKISNAVYSKFVITHRNTSIHYQEQDTSVNEAEEVKVKVRLWVDTCRHSLMFPWMLCPSHCPCSLHVVIVWISSLPLWVTIVVIVAQNEITIHLHGTMRFIHPTTLIWFLESVKTMATCRGSFEYITQLSLLT